MITIKAGDATPTTSGCAPTRARYRLRIDDKISTVEYTFRRACEHACHMSQMWGGTVAVVRASEPYHGPACWKTIVAYDSGQRSYYDWREVSAAREAERASGEYSATLERTRE